MDQIEKKLYTKTGDKGLTSLIPGSQVSKADERVDAVGCVEEIIAHLGLVRVSTTCPIFDGKLRRIMKTLKTLSQGLADPRSGKFAFSAEEISFLERDMDKMLSKLPEDAMAEHIPGGCEQSAKLDMARAVTRSAERAVVAMDRRYSVPAISKVYINRLSDYLGVAAVYADFLAEQTPKTPAEDTPATPSKVQTISPDILNPTVENVIEQVMSRLGSAAASIDLARAKQLISAVETAATLQGKQAVIAVVNAAGNPVAVHVMDGAFLVSFDVAVKKAYTAVAVKMSTMELNALCQPGGTFYGLQSLDSVVTFGGGVPIKVGGVIVGGLGVSGGTGEEDHALCLAGLAAFEQM